MIACELEDMPVYEPPVNTAVTLGWTQTSNTAYGLTLKDGTTEAGWEFFTFLLVRQEGTGAATMTAEVETFVVDYEDEDGNEVAAYTKTFNGTTGIATTITAINYRLYSVYFPAGDPRELEEFEASINASVNALAGAATMAQFHTAINNYVGFAGGEVKASDAIAITAREYQQQPNVVAFDTVLLGGPGTGNGTAPANGVARATAIASRGTNDTATTAAGNNVTWTGTIEWKGFPTAAMANANFVTTANVANTYVATVTLSPGSGQSIVDQFTGDPLITFASAAVAPYRILREPRVVGSTIVIEIIFEL